MILLDISAAFKASSLAFSISSLEDSSVAFCSLTCEAAFDNSSFNDERELSSSVFWDCNFWSWACKSLVEPVLLDIEFSISFIELSIWVLVLSNSESFCCIWDSDCCWLSSKLEIDLSISSIWSSNFLFTLWKRVRKYGAFCTGITQNVEDLLQSHTARTMLANSEFIIMLNQASTDRIELAKLLNISDLQMSFITNVGAGEGLIKVGSSLVPFVNKFPKNTRLYTLMTTKPGES